MVQLKLEIPSRSRHCFKGGEAFSEGMHYYSLIEELDAKGYIRKDYCITCWHEIFSNEKPQGLSKAHWKSQIPVKKQNSGQLLRRDERALALLKSIYQSDSIDDAIQAFVLALFLVRSKLLRLRQELVQDDGSTVLLYEIIETEEILILRKVDLSNIKVESVQQIIAAKLSELSCG